VILLRVIIARSFIPVFGIAYFPLEIFGVERRFIEGFAGWVRHFSITHDV
jgi:hypothetical protein